MGFFLHEISKKERVRGHFLTCMPGWSVYFVSGENVRESKTENANISRTILQIDQKKLWPVTKLYEMSES